jgi:glycosyltransferase involved in cell wall biosynthesis
MGTFEPRKAQGALVVAFAEVARSHQDVTLVLVGDTGTDYAIGVRGVAERLQLGERIRLVPVVEDHFPWYSAADVFVIASDVESMPRTLLEAMAFELPVAAAAVWGVPEVVTDGENGLLFEPRDVAALVAALEHMLDMPAAERRHLGVAAAETVARNYDASEYVGTYCRLLRALAQDPDVPLTEVIGSRAE